MNIAKLLRVLALLIALGIAVLLIFEIAAIADLYSFEYAGLYRLLGVRGILTMIVLNVGVVLLGSRLLYVFLRRPHPYPRTTAVLLGLAALVMLWVLEWMFMSTPLTARIVEKMRGSTKLQVLETPSADFAGFSLVRGAAADPETIRRLRIMYERVRLNNPSVYAAHPIAATIDKYAAKYAVDPEVLFYLNYIDSFYGEAVSGPVPFFAMTPETIRDTVQVHLPAWFVENGIRRALISHDWFNRLFGEALGFKLRYAVHKATLDVSLSPYALNTYSDEFLVLRTYPQEFPELSAGPDAPAAVRALRDSFARLRDSALLPPFEQPYTHAPYDERYYDTHRDDLKRFARAVFYLTLLDFDFATRTQALLTRYQRDYFEQRLGAARWAALPGWQRGSMLTMIRDLYTPGVGKLGYNLYAIPEINCTPLSFVADEAVSGVEPLPENPTTLWRPHDYSVKLWAGATYRLRIFDEVWALAHGDPIPGLHVETTTDDSLAVLSLSAN